MVCEPHSGGNRQCPAVKTVKHVAFDIVGEFRCLPYPGNDSKLMRLNVHIDHRIFKGLEDAVIAASRTPCGTQASVIL